MSPRELEELHGTAFWEHQIYGKELPKDVTDETVIACLSFSLSADKTKTVWDNVLNISKNSFSMESFKLDQLLCHE